ncbi:CoA ester lyase [Gordonia sp. HY002]|uniref:HpcH/HpaI aldolase/citrate lyase family protein n=1 Tax=Gordonia zhenghanii TaxID=2911516 RepID=UPI001EF05A43|nr:CoA ester lyase [Gordonia zhenghanii]MCF8570251.1 CoA ester lyase [Gordonia zhenghanii]MCF8606836.1 CoA ester lyase [Gordonia zhenghanii]
MTVEPRDRTEPWIPAGPALLFCPADRPERYAKALDRADMVILDLEDAVAPSNKAAARDALVDNPQDPDRVIVRINAAGTADHDLDLAALAKTSYRLVMQAKTEDPAQITAHGLATIALIETPMGALRAEAIVAAANCVGLMWGAEDLVAGLGGSSSRFGDDEAEPGEYRDLPKYVRSHVRLAAGAYRKATVDAIHADIGDVDGLVAEVRDAVALGYTATACIHPSQAAHIRDGYAPSPERVDWARRVLDGAAEHDGGVFALDGDMIDGPIIAQARATLARAGQRPTD